MRRHGEKVRSLQLPPLVPLLALLLFTVGVGLYSVFAIFITYAHLSTQKGWTVCSVTVFPVWVLVGYCWCRTIAEKPLDTPDVYEQPEGVWPPAPTQRSQEPQK